MHFSRVAAVSALLAGTSYASSVPSNVQSFYNGLISKKSCSSPLKSGFTAESGGKSTFSYCGDHFEDYNVIYIQGTGGDLADMDIDCDGAQKGKLDDGRCGSSTDTQSQTAFKSKVAGYNKGIKDLDSFAHPYVVFGNQGSKAGYQTFDAEAYGVEPLSVIAVVCNNKMFFGIWGDTNGDDDKKAMVGEASISMATLCFGKEMNGDNGHSEMDVLYIAFPGSEAVPGANGADWAASNPATFEKSLQTLGNKLVKRIGSSGGGGSTPTATAKPPSATCSWAGHCAGATCKSDDDCSDELACKSGKCAVDSNVVPVPCEWEGHCAGAKCSSHDDCSDELSCKSGKCA